MLWCCPKQRCANNNKMKAHTMYWPAEVQQTVMEAASSSSPESPGASEIQTLGRHARPRASFFIFVRMDSFSLIWKFLVLCSFKISHKASIPGLLCWRVTPRHHCLSLPCPCWRGSVNLCFTARHRPPQSIWRNEPFRETWGREWGWSTSRFSYVSLHPDLEEDGI